MAINIYGDRLDLRVAQVMNVSFHLGLILNLSCWNVLKESKNQAFFTSQLCCTNKIALETKTKHYVYGKIPIIEYLSDINLGNDLFGDSYFGKMTIKSSLHTFIQDLEILYYAASKRSAQVDLTSYRNCIHIYLNNLNVFFLWNTYISEKLSVADVCLHTIIYYLKSKELFQGFDNYPYLRRWFDTISGSYSKRPCIFINGESEASTSSAATTNNASESVVLSLTDEQLAVKQLERCKTKFDFDAWKQIFENCDDIKNELMTWLINNFDKENMSVYSVNYVKGPDELRNLLISRGQLTTFMKKFHSVLRKHSFVGFVLTGEDKSYEISGLMIVKTPDFYNFANHLHPLLEFCSTRQLYIDNEIDKIIIQHYLNALRYAEGSSLHGSPVVESKFLS